MDGCEVLHPIRGLALIGNGENGEPSETLDDFLKNPQCFIKRGGVEHFTGPADTDGQYVQNEVCSGDGDTDKVVAGVKQQKGKKKAIA